MKILITGATGLIGQSLGKKLVEAGHQIKIVSRNKLKAQQQVPFPCEVIECDLSEQALAESDFSDCEAVVHLLGESVDGRWTEEKKSEILNSRKKSSENLLKNIPASIRTIVTASAQGIYGDRQNEELSEESNLGSDFLSEVCKEWEKPFRELNSKQEKTRVVILRIGLVLSQRGGALKKLISLFQKNLGAALGSGEQWMSWISLRDLTEVFFSKSDEFKVSRSFKCRSAPSSSKLRFYKKPLSKPQYIAASECAFFCIKNSLG